MTPARSPAGGRARSFGDGAPAAERSGGDGTARPPRSLEQFPAHLPSGDGVVGADPIVGDGSSATEEVPDDLPVTDAFTVFDTVIGSCGIAWGPGGITAVQLPEGSAEATAQRLAAAHPDASRRPPSPGVAAVVERIQAVLTGTADDLADVPLDLRGRSEFERGAYAVARSIAPGHTQTYGQVAERIGNPGLARAVGRAMGANPFPIVVPCHRVLGADGSIGGFSAHGGAVTKRRMLLAEGVPERDGPALFDAAELFGHPAGSV